MNPKERTAQGSWISILQYATEKDISISTIRRYIKADKIQYKIDHGRYLIWDESPSPPKTTPHDASPAFDEVHLKLQRAEEEIAELKTLIAFYEEKISP
ncbi:MAG: hypothetical protein ACO3A2_01440 [Bdellovibrionia bacterium]